MARPPEVVTRPPLLPAPTQEKEAAVSGVSLADEAHHRALSKKYEGYAEDNSDNPQGPKWAAEAAKQKRIALGIRAGIDEREHDNKLMEHERTMAGLGRRGN